GIAEIKADAELLREIEQRPRLRARHVALEIAVDLGLVGHPVAREERRQCQLGKDDKLDAGAVCLAQQRAEPLDDGLAAGAEIEQLDLFRTDRDTDGGGAPIFVFIHGGAWRAGSAKTYAAPAEMFTRAGAHYIVPDFVWVQDAGGSLFPMAEQVCRAVAWVYE